MLAPSAGDVLPIAVAVAISPGAITTAIILLLSPNGRVRAALFAWIAGMSGLAVSGLGVAEGVVIANSLPLALGAGVGIAQDTNGDATAWVAVAICMVIAAIGVLAPLLVAVVGGRRLDPIFADLRVWFDLNTSPVIMITPTITGRYFLGKGLAIFS